MHDPLVEFRESRPVIFQFGLSRRSFYDDKVIHIWRQSVQANLQPVQFRGEEDEVEDFSLSVLAIGMLELVIAMSFANVLLLVICCGWRVAV